MARAKLNKAQAKLLANFSADLAKGLTLGGSSVPFISKEMLIFKELMMIAYFATAASLLKMALEFLKGVKE